MAHCWFFKTVKFAFAILLIHLQGFPLFAQEQESCNSLFGLSIPKRILLDLPMEMVDWRSISTLFVKMEQGFQQNDLLEVKKAAQEITGDPILEVFGNQEAQVIAIVSFLGLKHGVLGQAVPKGGVLLGGTRYLQEMRTKKWQWMNSRDYSHLEGIRVQEKYFDFKFRSPNSG